MHTTSPSPLVAIHLIPSDVIGGVEIAARSLSSGPYPFFLLKKYFLSSQSHAQSFGPNDCAGTYQSVNDPRNFFKALLWLHFQRPDLLVASLWRCYLLMIVHKLTHPRCKIVCFIHSAAIFNFLDGLISFVSIAFATQVWADCHTTILQRIPRFLRRKSFIVSFVLQRQNSVTQVIPKPAFIFWGRLSKVKGLERGLQLFCSLLRIYPDASFYIVGPDGGEFDHLIRLCHSYNIIESVHFLGPRSKSEIVFLASKTSFYLQTSYNEGFAMSVVEAMQLGLVPVVTPVGEIARYCHDGHNSLLVTDPESTTRRIVHVISTPGLYTSLRDKAIETWVDAPLYRDDFLARCSDLLKA